MNTPLAGAGSRPRDTCRITGVWLLLCAATVLSFWLGIERLIGSRRAAAVMILTIAMIKVRLVIRQFMNVRTAPRMLQAACDLWVLLLGAALICFYWRGHG